LLDVAHVAKSFGELLAVDDISFFVAPGKIFGLLGPNGAGKTTTISMISGLLKPSSGAVSVDGIRLDRDAIGVKRRLGVVPQEIAIYEDLTAPENLDFWGGVYGLRGATLRAKRDELLQLVGLADRAKEPVRQFSGGMKRRLNLAMGLVHGPKLVLLDEPTVGIDPQARLNILQVVRDIVAAGTTVLYTTHYLEEAEDLCDELAIMDHGKILAQGSITELKAQLGDGSLLTLQGQFDPVQSEKVSGIAGLKTLEWSEERALLLVERGAASVGGVLEKLYASGLHLRDVQIKEPNLEDLFLKLTGRELRD
jgi:linearmycin/streptolysin S transport system ATP-binding protein